MINVKWFTVRRSAQASTTTCTVDAYGEHDQRCPHSFKLGRHDAVQAVTQRLLQRGGIQTSWSSVGLVFGFSVVGVKPGFQGFRVFLP